MADEHSSTATTGSGVRVPVPAALDEGKAAVRIVRSGGGGLWDYLEVGLAGVQTVRTIAHAGG